MTGLWSSVVGGLLGKVAPKVADYYIAKQEQKAQYKLEVANQKHQIELERLKGKTAWEIAKTQRAEASEGRDHEWELQAQKLSGWKDEYVLIVLSLPFIGAFFPFTQDYVLEGFNTVGMTPEWYRWLVMTIFTAVYGIRLWRRKA